MSSLPTLCLQSSLPFKTTVLLLAPNLIWRSWVKLFLNQFSSKFKALIPPIVCLMWSTILKDKNWPSSPFMWSRTKNLCKALWSLYQKQPKRKLKWLFLRLQWWQNLFIRSFPEVSSFWRKLLTSLTQLWFLSWLLLKIQTLKSRPWSIIWSTRWKFPTILKSSSSTRLSMEWGWFCRQTTTNFSRPFWLRIAQRPSCCLGEESALFQM